MPQDKVDLLVKTYGFRYNEYQLIVKNILLMINIYFVVVVALYGAYFSNMFDSDSITGPYILYLPIALLMVLLILIVMYTIPLFYNVKKNAEIESIIELIYHDKNVFSWETRYGGFRANHNKTPKIFFIKSYLRFSSIVIILFMAILMLVASIEAGKKDIPVMCLIDSIVLMLFLIEVFVFLGVMNKLLKKENVSVTLSKAEIYGYSNYLKTVGNVSGPKIDEENDQFMDV